MASRNVANDSVLYHGTSTARLTSIIASDCMQTSRSATPVVSTTLEYSVGEYFACAAVFGDEHDQPDKPTLPIVLILDGEALLKSGYFLTEFSDDVWGEGECDWESEIACWSDIRPIREFVMAVEHVPAERYRDFRTCGKKPFLPPWYLRCTDGVTA